MPNHVAAVDSNRHPPQGASVATSGQVMRANGADSVSWVSTGGDVTGSPNAYTVIDLTISGESTGDLLYRNATNWVRLPIGTVGQVLTVAGGIPTWAAGGAGSGDFVGPAAATDNAIVRFDTATGKLGQNSNIIVNDAQANGTAIDFPNGSVAVGGNNGTLGATSAYFGYGAAGNFTDVTSIGNGAAVSGSNSVALGRASAAGSSSVALGRGANAGNNTSITIGRTATTTASNQFVIGSTGISYDAWFGPEGVSSTTAAIPDWVIRGTSASGTDKAGTDVRIQSGSGTGAGVPGLLYLATPNIGVSGTTLHTATDRIIIGGTTTTTFIGMGNPDDDNIVATPVTLLTLTATDSNSGAQATDFDVTAGDNVQGSGAGRAGDIRMRGGSTLAASTGRGGDVIAEAGTSGAGAGGAFRVYTANTGSPVETFSVNPDGDATIFVALKLTDQRASPPIGPLQDESRVYGFSYAERVLPTLQGELGRPTILASSWADRQVVSWVPGVAATASLAIGSTWTVTNTQAHPTCASTNLMTSLNRATYTTTAVANNASGIRTARETFWRGNAAGLGGLFYFSRFGVETFDSAMQVVNGMYVSVVLGIEPSTINNCIIVCKDSTDANWQFVIRNTGATTKVDLGVAVAAGTVLDFYAFAGPNAGEVVVRIVNVSTGAVLQDNVVYSANLPTSTTFLGCNFYVRTTAAVAVAGFLCKIQCENDL